MALISWKSNGKSEKEAKQTKKAKNVKGGALDTTFATIESINPQYTCGPKYLARKTLVCLGGFVNYGRTVYRLALVKPLQLYSTQ